MLRKFVFWSKGVARNLLDGHNDSLSAESKERRRGTQITFLPECIIAFVFTCVCALICLQGDITSDLLSDMDVNKIDNLLWL